MTRQEGLYWVVENPPPHSSWTIAQWNDDDKVWLFCGGGVGDRATDEELYYIGPMAIESIMQYVWMTESKMNEGYLVSRLPKSTNPAELPWILHHKNVNRYIPPGDTPCLVCRPVSVESIADKIIGPITDVKTNP